MSAITQSMQLEKYGILSVWKKIPLFKSGIYFSVKYCLSLEMQFIKKSSSLYLSSYLSHKMS